MKQPRIRRLPTNAEGDQRNRVGMDDRSNVGADIVDRLMKRKLRRRRMGPFQCPIGLDANDVVARQVAFVDTSRRDPDVAAGSRIERLPPDVVVMR